MAAFEVEFQSVVSELLRTVLSRSSFLQVSDEGIGLLMQRGLLEGGLVRDFSYSRLGFRLDGHCHLQVKSWDELHAMS